MLADNYLKKLISNKAHELGFVKVGFAKAEVLEKESGRLRKWLDNGYDADMGWIEKGYEKRKDVRLIMEDAKTVISLAFNYYTPFEHSDELPKISRYAWGKDYHKVLKKKLKELCAYLENLTPLNPHSREALDLRLSKRGADAVRTKYYVDDGPVMEKAWAVRAGIGWMGKHTNVINQEYGSWIFLSEIITNLEFEIYDEPIEDLCGTCRLCIEACPTGAIIGDYKLDSNLCISYQTIENRGEIPKSINLDGCVFGCDICQDVCPFNKNDKVTHDQNFFPKSEIYQKMTSELEEITEVRFNSIFGDSPVKRTKYSGWKRNLSKIKSV